MPSSGLARILFTQVRQRVLGVLLANPARSFYANEIIGLVQSGTGAVQRELAKLEASGLVTVTTVGRQKHYQANAQSPVFEELRSLALKTFALADVLRDALAPHATNIRAAFVYGSVAKESDRASSDIDVMIIAERVTYAELFSSLDEASARLGRKIAPTLYTPAEWSDGQKRKNAIVARVLAQPKIWLVGGEPDLGPP
jgi:predicted nucleotidyltransferase